MLIKEELDYARRDYYSIASHHNYSATFDFVLFDWEGLICLKYI